jgi:hypothetical protein
MADKSHDAEPKQKTSKGAEIPIPTREDFLRDLRKVASSAKPADAPGSDRT